MPPSRRLRVLLLAEQCNPAWPSLPVVGHNYAVALSQRCDVTVVTQIRNKPEITARHRSPAPELRFEFIDTEYIASPLHRLATVIRGDPEVAWSTNMAMAYLPYIEFERQAWRRFRSPLEAGDFDVVHRITPMSPTLPSWIAGRTRQPFVIGPLNGNLDWPAAFSAEQRREKEQMRFVRGAARHLPFARRTRRRTDRVLAAFQHTIDDLPDVPQDRLEMMPEVGFDPDVFYPPAWLDRAESAQDGSEPGPGAADGVTFLFVGRLVPYKLAQVVVEAFLGSAVLSEGGHRLRVVGDGPERDRIEQVVSGSSAGSAISVEGRLDQRGVAAAMRASDVFVFPSIRELGAGVVVEAMATGLLSIVVDYGGPADLVGPERGIKVPLASFDDLVLAFRREMEHCVALRGSSQQLQMRRAAVAHAFDHLTWAAKARRTEEIYWELLNSR